MSFFTLQDDIFSRYVRQFVRLSQRDDKNQTCVNDPNDSYGLVLREGGGKGGRRDERKGKGGLGGGGRRCVALTGWGEGVAGPDMSGRGRGLDCSGRPVPSSPCRGPRHRGPLDLPLSGPRRRQGWRQSRGICREWRHVYPCARRSQASYLKL